MYGESRSSGLCQLVSLEKGAKRVGEEKVFGFEFRNTTAVYEVVAQVTSRSSCRIYYWDFAF